MGTQGSWHEMLLAEGRAEATALAEQASRTAAEYRATGAEQPYQDELIALTARIKAVPAEQAGTVIASLLGIIAWGRQS